MKARDQFYIKRYFFVKVQGNNEGFAKSLRAHCLKKLAKIENQGVWLKRKKLSAFGPKFIKLFDV